MKLGLYRLNMKYQKTIEDRIKKNQKGVKDGSSQR